MLKTVMQEKYEYTCVHLHMYVFMQTLKIGGLDVSRVTNVLMACQDYMKKIDVRGLFC